LSLGGLGHIEQALGLASRIVNEAERRVARARLRTAISEYLLPPLISLPTNLDFPIDQIREEIRRNPESLEAIVKDLFYIHGDMGVDMVRDLLPKEKKQAMLTKYAVNSGWFLADLYKLLLGDEEVRILEENGYDYPSLVKEWNLASPRKCESTLENIFTITDVEKHRKKGIGLLHDEYGLSMFGRYPVELLVDMIDTHHRDVPYGVVLLAKEDHNGVFYRSKSSLEQFREALDGKYHIRIIEAGNKIGILKRLLSLHQMYGSRRKIGFMVVGAHGTATSMNFGHGGRIGIKDLQTRATTKLKGEVYENRMPWAFWSCETGEKEGIGQRFSETFGAPVIAPEIATREEKVVPVFDDGGKIVRLDVTYVDGKTAAFGI
jgi:hypothetical protein